MNKVILALTIGTLTTTVAHAQADGIPDQDNKKAIETSLLFTCQGSKMIGINNYIKKGPWVLFLSVDSSGQKQVTHSYRAKFDTKDSALSWVDTESENEIVIDPKNETEVIFKTRKFDSKNTVRSKCTLISK